MNPLITPKRLHMYPLAALCGVVIGFLLLVATTKGTKTVLGGRLGGDFPAFYGAGHVVRLGLSHSLYDPAVQQQMQADLLVENPGGWIHFAYPPIVALAYAPFSLLSFKAAYVLHTTLQATFCLLALWLLRPVLPPLGSYFLPLFAACLTFYPLFRAVVGGQNSAVSLLCAAGSIAALHQRRDFAAGLWLSVWLFKPQFAVPVALVACRSRRTLVGLLVGSFGSFCLSAMVMGVDWPIVWFRAATAFAAADRLVDRSNGISIIDLTSDFGLPAFGLPAAALVAAVVMVLALRRNAGPAARIGLASSMAPLVSPHALYYDGALALVGLIFPAQVWHSGALPWMAWIWALGTAQMLRDWIPIAPVAVALGSSLTACIVCLRASPLARTPPPSRPSPGPQRSSTSRA